MSHVYICAHCGRKGISERPQGEAEAEYQQTFSAEEREAEGRTEVCTPCYEEFMKWYNSLSPEQLARIRRGESPYDAG